jgi:hypothetical protein
VVIHQDYILLLHKASVVYDGWLSVRQSFNEQAAIVSDDPLQLPSVAIYLGQVVIVP